MELSFLLSSDAAAQRISRNSSFVAHMETASGFVELDAESVAHAHTLCTEWCKNGRAMSASARRVFERGTLGPVIGRIVSETDFWALN